MLWYTAGKRARKKSLLTLSQTTNLVRSVRTWEKGCSWKDCHWELLADSDTGIPEPSNYSSRLAYTAVMRTFAKHWNIQTEFTFMKKYKILCPELGDSDQLSKLGGLITACKNLFYFQHSLSHLSNPFLLLLSKCWERYTTITSLLYHWTSGHHNGAVHQMQLASAVQPIIFMKIKLRRQKLKKQE